jgi:hypothetical protein
MQIRVHNLFAELGAIEYPFIQVCAHFFLQANILSVFQWVPYAPIQVINSTSFDVTLSQDGRKPEVKKKNLSHKLNSCKL